MVQDKRNILLEIAVKDIATSIHELSSFENNPATLQEIKAVLNNTNTSMLNTEYRQQIINLKNAWNILIVLVGNRTFNEKDINIWKSVHFILGRKEIMNAGSFRNGIVEMDGADNYTCPSASKLESIFKKEIHDKKVSKTIDYALDVFVSGTYNQFFYNGNKRIARFMTNGILINNGIGFLKIHKKDVRAFHKELQLLFNNNDRGHIKGFLKSHCIVKVDKYL